MISKHSRWMMTTDTITLCSMRAADGGARLLLQIEIKGEAGTRNEMLCVFASRLSHIPRCGTLTEAEYAGLCEESELTKAMDIGLRLLGANGASHMQLVQRMRQRGVKSAIAEAAARELAARGYLNECAGALREAEKGLAKLWGNRRILADVRAKGYGDAALDCVAELLAGENTSLRCAKLIKRRHMVLPHEDAALSRFVASLMRYGYTVSEIKQALRENGDI